MPTLRTRASKGTDLTPTEADTNFKRTVSQKTTTYSCLVSDNRSMIECSSSTPFTVTLGDAATMAAAETGDYEVTINNIGSGAVTVARAGSNTINGASTSITLAQYSGVTLKVISAGTGYVTIATGLGGLTSSVAEINGLDGLTASRAVVTTSGSILTASATTATELGYVNGVTSAIQTQMDLKAALASPTFTGAVVLPSTTSIGNVSATELGYIDGVTSAVQTQLTLALTYNARANHTGTQLMSTISNAGALATLNTVAAAQIDAGAVTVPKIEGGALQGYKDFGSQATASATFVVYKPTALSGSGVFRINIPAGATTLTMGAYLSRIAGTTGEAKIVVNGSSSSVIGPTTASLAWYDGAAVNVSAMSGWVECTIEIRDTGSTITIDGAGWAFS